MVKFSGGSSEPHSLTARQAWIFYQDWLSRRPIEWTDVREDIASDRRSLILALHQVVFALTDASYDGSDVDLETFRYLLAQLDPAPDSPPRRSSQFSSTPDSDVGGVFFQDEYSWSTSRSRPFNELVAVLERNLGEYGLRGMMVRTRLRRHLNSWLVYSSSHEVFEMFRRWEQHGYISGTVHAEIWSRFVAERQASSDNS